MDSLQKFVLGFDGKFGFLQGLEERRTRWFFRTFPIAAWLAGSEVILDIGCGSFDLTNEMSKSGAFIASVDWQDLRRLRYRKMSNAFFCLAKGEALPFRNNAFDAVTLFWMLHHSENPHLVLSEAIRVLRPNGTVIILEDVLKTPSFLNRKVVTFYDRLINLDLSGPANKNDSKEGWLRSFDQFPILQLRDVVESPAVPFLTSFTFCAIRLKKNPRN